MNPGYTEEVLKRFSDPKNCGEIKEPDAIGEAGDPSCEDLARLYLKIENNIIKVAKFKVIGCAAAIASSDMACELMAGKTIEDALKITADDIAKALGGLPEQKMHCSVMAEEALVRAVDDYKARNGQYYDHLSYYSFVPCGSKCECGATAMGTMTEEQMKKIVMGQG